MTIAINPINQSEIALEKDETMIDCNQPINLMSAHDWLINHQSITKKRGIVR